MAEKEETKISFSITKAIKKPMLVKQVPQEQKKVDYINSIDDNVIKIIGVEEIEEKNKELIVPLPDTWRNRIVNKINAESTESKVGNVNNTKADEIKEQPIEPPQEGLNKVFNRNLTLVKNSVSNIQIVKSSNENESKVLTLEQEAAKEIIEDLKSTENKDDKLKDLTVPLTEKHNLSGGEESTLDDYENVPINTFGFAMIRGMGWKPDKGMDKNERVVVPAEQRPKRMGLGVDNFILQKQKLEKKEELPMVTGSFVKINVRRKDIKHKYGQIEGFDENMGRIFVKMALEGNTISVEEYTVEVVTKTEYLKNSNVLNITKYEEYKSKEGTSKRRSTSPESVSSDSDESGKKKRRKEDENEHRAKKLSKKSKSRRKDTSGSDSDSRKKSKRRDSSSSSDTHRAKKTKKSKKHKETHKERERRKDKKPRYSESLDRRKSKKHGRSRSSNRR